MQSGLSGSPIPFPTKLPAVDPFTNNLDDFEETSRFIDEEKYRVH